MEIVAVSDSPRLTTGFGNVAYQIYEGLKEHDLTVFGIMDYTPDVKKGLPYSFWPANVQDPTGIKTAASVIDAVKPDLVWIMLDPGNIVRMLSNDGGSILRLRDKYKENNQKAFKIVIYPPIEGTPIPSNHFDMFKHLKEMGDEVILWSESSAKNVKEACGLELDYIHFGADHAPFKQYPLHIRKKLREIVGIDDYFICGQVGVNKRTKEFPTLIYTAKIIREEYGINDIIFYCHTEPAISVMQGYNLLDISKIYGVEDMFLWKPDSNMIRGGINNGVTRDKKNLKELLEMDTPHTAEERRDLWAEFDFITRLNCLDIYTDVSSVEGWGLPPGEAMSCGVPALVPNDGDVRKEIFGGGAKLYEVLPRDTWTTWHTGVRLVNIDPHILAKEIVHLYNNRDELKKLSKRGLEHMQTYKWDNTRKKMNEVINAHML